MGTIKVREAIKTGIYFPDMIAKGRKSNFSYPYFFTSFAVTSESFNIFPSSFAKKKKSCKRNPIFTAKSMETELF